MNLARYGDVDAPFTYTVVAEFVDDVVVMQVPATSVHIDPPDP